MPYFEHPSLSVGPLTVHAFGVVTATAVAVGLWLARRRAGASGLDLEVHDGLAWYSLVFGFLGAHVYSVVLYFPEELTRDPFLLFRVWENISSTGGLLGGALGIWVYLGRHRLLLDVRERRLHVDAIAYALPFAWAIGRLACTLAHDHPGTITTFPLSIELEAEQAREFVRNVYTGASRANELPTAGTLSQMGFHDLGWYEFLYLALVAVPIFAYLDRKPRPSGFWVVAFVAVYGPVRFLLDFLRVADSRYAGLTPAQWAILAVLLASAALSTSQLTFRSSPAAMKRKLGARRNAGESLSGNAASRQCDRS